jgi:UDP-N-acetylglucosamine acyltransferase
VVIHPSAIVSEQAKLAAGVVVGPWSIIGADVEIGAGTQIDSHVVIKGPTKIGTNNKIHQFNLIGEDTPDKKYQGERTWLEIGNDNVIREFCSIHRGTEQGGGITKIGNGNLFMAYVHIAHDCMVGDQTVFANYSALAGHVHVDDYATFAGYAAVHQFCRVGKYSFIAKATMVVQDVLPYVLVAGHEAKTCGLNKVGLLRHGFTRETVEQLRQAYKIILRQGLTVEQAANELEVMAADCPEVDLMLQALKQSERGITR